MRKIAFAAAVAFASCAPAASPQAAGVGLNSNQGVTITLSGDGATRIVAHTDQPTPISASEMEVVAGIRDNPAAAGSNVVPVSGDTEGFASERIEPDKIKLRFLMVAPHDSVLLIENGYDQGLIYHASILVNDRASATDVCLVMPGRHGVEHWPYPIDRIQLSGLTLTPWRNGDPVPCAQ